MKKTRELPKNAFNFIAMIHVLPLCGSPGFSWSPKKTITRALEELEVYKAGNADAVMLENMHDRPYTLPPLDRNTVLAMMDVAAQVRENTDLPIGIQMLEGANMEALEIATSCRLDFIRVEGFTYAHVGGAGLVNACAGPLLRKRAELDASHIKIFADVKKKHCAHALTSDLSIGDIVKQSEFFLADGIIITGKFTGEPADVEDLDAARDATDLPILIGSGITPENVSEYTQADGYIVGTYLKQDGIWSNPVDPERVQRMARFIHN